MGIKRTVQVFLMLRSGRSGPGRWASWLAASLQGPYKARKPLALLTDRPFISPCATVYGGSGQIEIGPNCFIDDDVTIFAHPHGGRIVIGAGSSLMRGCHVEVGDGGSVLIGRDSHIQAGCHLKGFLKSTIIGNRVQLAPHCAFSPYQHGFDDVTVPIKDQPITSKGDIVVEDDAWLGLNVVVMDGVRIGRGAVIGAGAVVTRTIPAFAIAAGVPATVLRFRGELKADTAEALEEMIGDGRP
ncbi:MAG TPA: transferase [Chloroflexi bacterium]|nr:transferase [Chloroflexota bacterium]